MTTPADLVQNQLAYRENVGAATSGAAYSDGVTAGKLWLPIWSGEVINAYDEFNMFEQLVTSRVIPSGTTMEFPITGTVALEPSWDAGQELIGGSDAKTSTFAVSLDKRPMAAHFEIDNVDLMLTQWEFRNELARQAAMTLANTRDKQLYSYLVRAAVTSQIANDPRPALNLDSALYGDDGTGSLKLSSWGTAGATAAHRATGALSALEKVEKYIVFLQENNIPYDQLFMAVSPQCFMDIRSLGVARTNDNLSSGGRQLYFGGNTEGGYGTGLGNHLTDSYGQLHDTLEYMGCTIIKTNHGADQLRDISGATTIGEAKYNLDFLMGMTDTSTETTGVRAVMFTPDAVASLRLQGLKVDTVDDVRRNTTFTVASMMQGTGVLRPECAAIIHAGNASHADNDTRLDLRGAAKLDVDADGYVQQ
tara:strand:+ start:7723 stop:8985 length:1263 start_codon:yes stop_codon:yes gene_type:complete